MLEQNNRPFEDGNNHNEIRDLEKIKKCFTFN